MAAEQLHKLFLSILVGISLAMLYDVLRARRRAFKGIKVLSVIEDILYWAAVTVAIFFTILYANNGELRGFIIAGVICGIAFYLFFLSKHILNILVKLMCIIKTIVMWVYKVVSWPVITVVKIVLVPLKFLFKIVSAVGKKILVPLRKLKKKACTIKPFKRKRKVKMSE